jgi:hydrogenase nickel incorporation protein HypB
MSLTAIATWSWRAGRSHTRIRVPSPSRFCRACSTQTITSPHITGNDALGGEFRVAVIEGDLETENDAQRVRKKGVPAVQICTGSACHLDAHMIHDALHDLHLDELDILFIENVGNLVCPASFDLGQHRNVTLLSAPEGDDKPAKYPVMFRATDLLLLSKSDLYPVLDDFDPARATQALRNLANPAPVLRLSSRNGEGMHDWIEWLQHERQVALQ